MEQFYKIHRDLVSSVVSPIRRLLMDEIDWTKRLIGIKGSRGAGKTTFLLQYAKDNYGSEDRSCLYLNFNALYFTEHTIVEFAEIFYSNGGRLLLLDQMFKYENWSEELRCCYDKFPDLQIVFSGSPVMRLVDGNCDIGDVVSVYNLRGFSFREFLKLKTGLELEHYELDFIIKNHQQISAQVSEKLEPLQYFYEYLQSGFYPFFMESKNFHENLLKVVNMVMEVDILLIKQIDLKYLSKIRRLLYLIVKDSPANLNFSQLSKEIKISRTTAMNYVKYMQDARLLNLLYKQGDRYPKKPQKVFVHNTNLLYISNDKVDRLEECKTFFYNTIHSKHKLNIGGKSSDFLVDGTHNFTVLLRSKMKKGRDTNLKYAVDGIVSGDENNIPLWIFGFLY